MFGAVGLVMLVMFILGFALDFLEITYIVVPLVAPRADRHGGRPGVACNHDGGQSANRVSDAAVRLRPVLYSRGRAALGHHDGDLRGVVPFVILQLVALGLVALFPALATWLPKVIYG